MNRENTDMNKQFTYITLREKSELKDAAACWFNSKWGVPKEAYLECMEDYLSGNTELGWYLCLDGDKIIGGMGVIENDFHDRKDLTPNVCAVYTEEAYRCQGISGNLLNKVVEDLRAKGISPVYPPSLLYPVFSLKLRGRPSPASHSPGARDPALLPSSHRAQPVRTSPS